MDIALLSFEGGYFFLRWFHYLAGVMWIGLLYYFNFVQGEFMKEADAPAKANVVTKLLPRALFWFRYGALVTFLTGIFMIQMRAHQGGMSLFSTSWGVCILIGGLLGTLMFANVWLIIWPNQKIVINSALQVANGGAAIPEAAAAGARGLVASRTNSLFSIPLLFFMGAASHLPINVDETSNLSMMWLAVFILIGLIELNAIKGKLGPMTKITGFVHMGILLTVVLYGIVECFC